MVNMNKWNVSVMSVYDIVKCRLIVTVLAENTSESVIS